MGYSYNKLKKIFANSEHCSCHSQDCKANHRVCFICKNKIQWGEYITKANLNSKCQWEVDRSYLDDIEISNLKAVHPWCDEKK